MDVQIIHPEHEVSWLIHGFTIGMPIDLLEELLTDGGVDVIKILNFGWITVFNAPGIYVVPKVELIHIHGNLTHSFALFVSLILIFGITH